MSRNAYETDGMRAAPMLQPQISDAQWLNADTVEVPLDRITRVKLSERGVDPGRIRHRDLSNLNLSHADLSGIDLRGFILSQLNLEGANLRGVDLRSVSFASTNCVSASFIGADLRAANLGFGFFNNADFSGADLRGAQLIDAQCSDCIFAGADLRGVALGIKMVGADFRGSDLRGAMLPGGFDFAQLGCDVRGALQTPPRIDPAGNRRSAPRVQLRDPLRVFERKMMQIIGGVIDISSDGFQMASTRAVPIGNTYSLRIELPGELNCGHSIDVDACSIWCRFNERAGKYFSGFRYTVATQNGSEIIQDLMSKSLQRSTDFYGEPAQRKPDA